MKFGSLVVPLLILVVMWLVLVRPARRQQQRQRDLQQSIEPGDRVVLTSGFFGTVDHIDGSRVWIELAPGVVVEAARQAVVRREEPVPDGPDGSGAVDAPAEGPTSEPGGSGSEHLEHPDGHTEPPATDEKSD